jgi:3-oxoacyl-[acyl-carrier protein] reductase
MNQIFTNMGEVKKQVPMQRAAKPEEIADAVLFLLGPGAAYITGADIPVDGGISAKRA